MIFCANCGAANADATKFCGECGKGLSSSVIGTDKPTIAPPPETPPPAEVGAPSVMGQVVSSRLDFGKLSQNVQQFSQRANRSADILFVLDCTGSMQGEIDAIKEVFSDFVDTIAADQVQARAGLISYRDRKIGEEQSVLSFGGEPFTRDAAEFRRQVSTLRAKGGGDDPESSLDALLLAARQPFNPDPTVSKTVVLVTDAPPHIPDVEAQSIEQVMDAVRAAGIKQLYIVSRAADPECQIYLRLLEAVKDGLFFDLGKGDDIKSRADHFKKTLLRIGKSISTNAMTR